LSGLWAVLQRQKENTFGSKAPVLSMMQRQKNPDCKYIEYADRKKSREGLV